MSNRSPQNHRQSDPAPDRTDVATDVALESQPLPSTIPAIEPAPSYVKLAMRNMVRKGGKSLFHFGLTTLGLLGLLVGLAYLTR